MDRVAKDQFTVAEYFALERVSDERHEYDRGAFYTRGDDSLDHGVAQLNLARELQDALGEQAYIVLSGPLRIHAQANDYFTYTDLAVVRERPHFYEGRDATLLNPTLLVEVISAWSREYDRGARFERYKAIESLQEYALVDSEQAHVECLRRRDGEWSVSMFDGLDASCQFESLDCEIPLSRIYEKVTWLD